MTVKIGGSSCTSSITFAGEDTIADQESIQSSDKTFDEALDQASVQVAPLGWAVYLKVNAGPYEDPVNTLGQRDTAVIGYDRNDLKELAPDRDPYLTLVFPHPDWGEKAGDYGADYQPLDRSQTNEWYFVIRTSELLQDLKLSWQGPVDILKDSKLVDMDTGETVMLKKLSSFSTEWYGLQERHFKWVLKKSKNKKKPISEELN